MSDVTPVKKLVYHDRRGRISAVLHIPVNNPCAIEAYQLFATVERQMRAMTTDRLVLTVQESALPRHLNPVEIAAALQRIATEHTGKDISVKLAPKAPHRSA